VALLLKHNRPSLHRRYSRVPEHGYMYVSLTTQGLRLPLTTTVRRESNARGAQNFRKQETLEVLGARNMTRSRFNSEGPRILVTTVQNVAPPREGAPGICVPLAPSIVTILIYITNKLRSNAGGLQVILF